MRRLRRWLLGMRKKKKRMINLGDWLARWGKGGKGVEVSLCGH